MTNISSDFYFKSVMAKLFNPGSRIKVPLDFHKRMVKINELLENDYTGIVATILEFMIATGSVPMNFITDNQNLTDTLNDWSENKLNSNISKDIPRGLKSLTSQYLRERWTSSFIVLNIAWEKINDLLLPGKMWLSDGSVILVDGSSDNLSGKSYYLGEEGKEITEGKNTSVLIRKPFNSWYDDYPTPYLVKKGVLHNALLKKSLIEKQSDVIEEMIPYILALRAGDATLVAKNAMGDIENQLTAVKEGLKKAKRDKKYQQDSGDTILKGRYDLQVDHVIPDLTKLFNESIVKPVNNNLFCGLGLVELQGFSSDRQEAILNPKVMVEEILNGVMGAKELYDEVINLIIEKNSSLHPKHMGQDIRIVPGVVKAFLTDNMRKLIKDHVNTGILSIEDAFEALPQGYDFEISKKRRQQEVKNGDEDLFFPRVILNQDSNSRNDTSDPRLPTPNEIPKKKKNVKADEEEIMAPYSNNSELPPSVKDNLPQHAQSIFRAAFNSAIKNGKTEEDAFKIAWSAVKVIYKKNDDGKWIKAEEV